jgi:hypothetical protein
MTTVLDLVSQASVLLHQVARVERTTLNDDELVQLLAAEEAVGRFIDTSRVLTAGEVAERSRFELGADGLSMQHGHRKPVHLIEQVTRASQSEVLRRMRVGLAVRPRRALTGETLPPERAIVADAMIAGELGIESAAAIISCLKQAAAGSDATVERMDEAEHSLVALGISESSDLVWEAGRLWRDALDPDGIEPRYDAIVQRRSVTVGRERNGITAIHIKADPLSAALIKTALADSTTPGAVPRFMSQEDLEPGTHVDASATGEVIETPTDPRSREQKQFDILMGVFTAGVRATHDGPANLRTTGSVTAIIQLKDLESGTGFGVLQSSDEVIPASAVQELACDSGIRKIVLGDKGEPLFEGFLERYFTAAQRRAMVARDGTRCIGPGCQAPASWCHAHHVIFSSNDGSTDVDNGVLLCASHHYALHTGAFEIRMIDGMPWIRTRADAHSETAWKPASRNRLLMTAAA